MADKIDPDGLYRMRRENTQYVDLATGWSLAWPNESPPEVKPLPVTISSALESNILAGSIVKVAAAELTGLERMEVPPPPPEAKPELKLEVPARPRARRRRSRIDGGSD